MTLKLFSVQVLPQSYILTVFVENVKLMAVTVQVMQKKKKLLTGDSIVHITDKS